ncbi:MAG TPA: class I tRNA ligase family protein [Verrucomicrobiae bacterium]|jgi:methionyl-tRNA synthetase|nr:class I tRNA ligase family protein [Verrucomicrobiae bacterium]
MNKRFYITTAIDYVNGQPHLGHAYEKVVADVIARAQRRLGNDVFFLTGLDEHGQKVQQAALAEGKSPQGYCDELAQSWQHFASRLGLSNDDFVRTTQPRHRVVVQTILARLNEAGQFYRTKYKGFYSTSAETFLTEKDRLPDGTFDAWWGKVVELEEENYYFRLKEHQAWLIAHIEAHPEFIMPENRRNEVLGFLRNETLEDLCISRPAARLSWGIPIPFDPAYVTYVWFDALVNYISVPLAHGDPLIASALGLTPQAAGLDLWPADVHLIGKDILKFHAVYWPIMLKAMGLPLPRQILAHGWWQKEGQKLSKSTRNVVDPIAVIDEWGLDAFRYYLVRELAIGPDGNWTDAGFRSRYQSELANGLGNLVNRSLSMIKRYREGLVPAGENQLAREIGACRERTVAAYRNHQLQDALEHIGALIMRANQYIDQTSPFKLAKDPQRATELDHILYTLAEVCRLLGDLLWPVMPGTAEKLQLQLGFPAAPPNLAAAPEPIPPQHPLGEIFGLFPRKDLPPAGAAAK